jgi:peptidyl-dipeptidase Dcp
MNKRLAELFTTFGQFILREEAEVTWVDDLEQLAGVPRSLINTFAKAGEERGSQGRFAIQNTRSAVEPFLHYGENRKLRESVWRLFVNRGARDNEFNTKAIIKEIIELRARRARLLGYESHAHWRISTEMAQTPANAMRLLMDVWPKAVHRVNEEVHDMLKGHALADGVASIEPWDYRYYSEKVRKQRFDFDFNEIVPYLNAERLREGMFSVASELHGLSFVPVTNVPVFHSDVRVWEVRRRDPDSAAESHVGLFYFDPFCREGKRSGAWMTQYREQSSLLSAYPIVSNNSNFIKADPLLISWDDAVTMFHEFGHALHGLLSRVTYPSLSGTNVARDFVEFPSQLNEEWLCSSKVLENFARHIDTDAPIPDHLLRKLERAQTFNQGFKTVEYLACAIVDLKLHLRSDGVVLDPVAYEEDVLKEIGMPREVAMRHRMTHFAHIFSTDSYSAGYYSYLWADTLVADTVEHFKASPGGLFDMDIAKRLRECVLSVGNSVAPHSAYESFRGRPADPLALMRKRGFA